MTQPMYKVRSLSCSLLSLREKLYQKDLNPALNSLKQLEGIFLWISVITSRLAVVKGLLHSESSYLNLDHGGMGFLTGKMKF